jgi:homoserine kinase
LTLAAAAAETARPRRASACVRVPATSANLGPGFDVLGLALELHEQVRLQRIAGPPGRAEISVRGVSARRLPHDQNLLAYRAVMAVFERLGRPIPALSLELQTSIPKCGGLGGTGAAIVAGVVAANALEGEPLSRREVLDVAVSVEGHPDNVAPALLGGIVVCVHGRSGLVAKRLDPPRQLSAVICIPDQAVSTKAARNVLPRQVSREDAVFNLGRTALLVAAIQTGDWSLLSDAMDDRLHQPARGQILPALFPVIDAALAAGAHGAALSGSGAAMIALATRDEAAVARAMCAAATRHGLSSQSMVLRLAAAGATLVEAP